MKRLLTVAVALLAVVGSAMAQKVVEWRESQARVAEPVMGVYIKPLVAELQVVSAEKVKDVWEFTNKEVNALRNDVANLKARALFKSTNESNHPCDVIVAATFDIESTDGGYRVTVYGYPAKYVKWRTATPEDNAWIHNEKLTPTQATEATKAVQ